ncbi:MAG: hypothetical protein CMI18_06695 [Opitutaceae bacterium]|nr:hypothetical protein [Opitutaceae bacterium]
MGLPVTGKIVRFEGVVISRFEDGLITEDWELLDQLTLLQYWVLLKTYRLSGQ